MIRVQLVANSGRRAYKVYKFRRLESSQASRAASLAYWLTGKAWRCSHSDNEIMTCHGVNVVPCALRAADRRCHPGQHDPQFSPA